MNPFEVFNNMVNVEGVDLSLASYTTLIPDGLSVLIVKTGTKYFMLGLFAGYGDAQHARPNFGERSFVLSRRGNCITNHTQGGDHFSLKAALRI